MTEAAIREAPDRAAGGSPAFTLLGAGALHDAIAEALAHSGAVATVPASRLAQAAAGCELVIVATDGWDTSDHPPIHEVCEKAGVPWFPVRAELGRVVIGPLGRPGEPGCRQCMESRRRHARRSTDVHERLWLRHGAELSGRPSAWLTGLAVDTVGALAADEVARTAGGTSRIQNAFLAVDLRTLDVVRHTFLPDPLCPECGDLPDDTAERAEITLASQPKPTPDTYRMRALADEIDHLTDIYVDDEIGLMRGLGRSSQGGLVVSAVEVRLRPDNVFEAGFGRTRAYRSAELTALLEALERYGGVEPGGKRTIVRACYAEIADRALDPRTCGVHPPESYQTPGFPYRPFDENHVCRWVWGYSFARRAPILVPEATAYYRVHSHDPDDRPFFYEISNGCALGGCLEEAILFGILEVAERDAFLMTWYARLPVPRIDLTSAPDRAIPMQAAAISADTGYEILAFDTTMEQGIPCAWTMAVSPDGSGPVATSSAGSHLTLERAVLSALSELGPILTTEIRDYPENRERGRRMAADPSLVVKMQDHSVLHAAPEAFDRLGFLTGTTAVRDLSDVSSNDADAFRNADLRTDLLTVIQRYLDVDMDVIIVDQTAPEQRAGGLSCVKVLIPGALPMTFGHRNRRVDGLPRLLNVPHSLGHQPRPLHHDELNQDPHPFP
jgi:ribosomal protein S12 methylthiotransferase accessory factor